MRGYYTKRPDSPEIGQGSRCVLCALPIYFAILLNALTQGVDPEHIRADGWAIGYDERFPLSSRIQQALVFARYSEHDNLYAHPMVCTSPLYRQGALM